MLRVTCFFRLVGPGQLTPRQAPPRARGGCGLGEREARVKLLGTVSFFVIYNYFANASA